MEQEVVFVSIAQINKVCVQVNLQYLSEIITDGADPNSTDKYGQTALHEVRCPDATKHNVQELRFRNVHQIDSNVKSNQKVSSK